MPPKASHQQADRHIRASIEALAGAQVLYAGHHGAATETHTADAVDAHATAAAPAVATPATSAAPHEVDDMLSQRVFYPAHAKRKESTAYRASHRQLVDVEDRPCLVCGVRKSTLEDPAANPFGARALETHHRIVEWALANAIDLDKFNARIVGSFRRHDPHNPKYQADFTRQQMLDWIDADLDNLWVLCDVHHRHKYVGIHAISGPIWGPQDLLLPGFGPRMASDLLRDQ